MRKVSAIGLVIGVLFLAVVFGIASIPDEVLESNSIEKSDEPQLTLPQGPPIAEPETPPVVVPTVAETNIPSITEIIPQVDEPETPQVDEPETPQVDEPETNSEESESNVIRVVVSDGVGTVSR